MMRDARMYERLLKGLRNDLHSRKDAYSKAKGEIRRVIRNAGNCLASIDSSVHDKDRIDALDSLVSLFADGVFRMRSARGIELVDMGRIVDVYGAIVDAGMDSSVPDMGFASVSLGSPNHALLEVRSRQGATDMIIETYRTAIDRGLWRMPDGFRIVFGSYDHSGFPVPSDGAHKKLNMELHI